MQEHIDKLQRKLQEAFPGRSVNFFRQESPDSILPVISIKIDEKTLRAKYTMELEQELKILHPSIILEEEILNALICEYKELNRPLV